MARTSLLALVGRRGRWAPALGLMALVCLAGSAWGQGQKAQGRRAQGKTAQPVAPPKQKAAVTADARRIAATLKAIAAQLEAGKMQPATAFQQIAIVRQGWVAAQPKAKAPGAAKPSVGRKAKATGERPPKLMPIEASTDKLPTFAQFDAASARLDRRVAAGEITRAEARRQLVVLQKKLAVESGAMPANPSTEDLPRYRREKRRLVQRVNAGKMTVTRMKQELASLKARLESTRKAHAPATKKPAGKKPAARGGGIR